MLILLHQGAIVTNSLSHSAACIFFGGILLLVSGFMDLLLGNSFVAAVFMSFGLLPSVIKLPILLKAMTADDTLIPFREFLSYIRNNASAVLRRIHSIWL